MYLGCADRLIASDLFKRLAVDDRSKVHPGARRIPDMQRIHASLRRSQKASWILSRTMTRNTPSTFDPQTEGLDDACDGFI